MTLQKNKIGIIVAALLCGFIALTALLTLNIPRARGALTGDQPSLSNQFRVADMFASTTATLATSQIATSTNATSTNIVGFADSNQNGAIWSGAFDVRGAKHVDVYFTRGGAFAAANTGTSTFSVQGTVDGINWVYVNRLLTATSSPTASPGLVNGVYASDPNLGALPTIGAILPGNVATSTLHLIVDMTALNYRALRCISTIQVDGANACQIASTF